MGERGRSGFSFIKAPDRVIAEHQYFIEAQIRQDMEIKVPKLRNCMPAPARADRL
jgi:hypothetical protein